MKRIMFFELFKELYGAFSSKELNNSEYNREWTTRRITSNKVRSYLDEDNEKDNHNQTQYYEDCEDEDYEEETKVKKNGSNRETDFSMYSTDKPVEEDDDDEK